MNNSRHQWSIMITMQSGQGESCKRVLVQKCGKISGITSTSCSCLPVIKNLFWAVCLFAFHCRTVEWSGRRRTRRSWMDRIWTSPQNRTERKAIGDPKIKCDACGEKWEQARSWVSVVERLVMDGQQDTTWVKALSCSHPTMSMSIYVSMDNMQAHRAMSITCPWIVSSQSLFWTPVGSPRPVLSIIHKLLQLLSDWAPKTGPTLTRTIIPPSILAVFHKISFLNLIFDFKPCVWDAARQIGRDADQCTIFSVAFM